MIKLNYEMMNCEFEMIKLNYEMMNCEFEVNKLNQIKHKILIIRVYFYQK